MWKSLLFGLTFSTTVLSQEPIVWIFANGNFGGDQMWLRPTQQGVCYAIPGNFNDRISSLSIASPRWCDFFVDAGCVGTPLALGSGDHRTLPAWINDKISSYRCFLNGPG